MMWCEPDSARSLAVWKPIPELAPVIKTVLVVISGSLIFKTQAFVSSFLMNQQKGYIAIDDLDESLSS